MYSKVIMKFELRKSNAGLLQIGGSNETDEPIDFSTKVEQLDRENIELVIRVSLRGRIKPDPDAHLKVAVLDDYR